MVQSHQRRKARPHARGCSAALLLRRRKVRMGASRNLLRRDAGPCAFLSLHPSSPLVLVLSLQLQGRQLLARLHSSHQPPLWHSTHISQAILGSHTSHLHLDIYIFVLATLPLQKWKCIWLDKTQGSPHPASALARRLSPQRQTANSLAKPIGLGRACPMNIHTFRLTTDRDRGRLSLFIIGASNEHRRRRLQRSSLALSSRGDVHTNIHNSCSLTSSPSHCIPDRNTTSCTARIISIRCCVSDLRGDQDSIPTLHARAADAARGVGSHGLHLHLQSQYHLSIHGATPTPQTGLASLLFRAELNLCCFWGNAPPSSPTKAS